MNVAPLALFDAVTPAAATPDDMSGNFAELLQAAAAAPTPVAPPKVELGFGAQPSTPVQIVF